MKRSFLPILIALATGLWSASPVRIHAAEPAATPKEQVTAFYKFYLHALNTNADPLTKNRGTLGRYISVRFLKEVERQSKSEGGLEADPFICAQDFDKDWEKNIKTESMGTGGKAATVKVVLDGKEIPSHCLTVKLVQAADGWKIDRISSTPCGLKE